MAADIVGLLTEVGLELWNSFLELVPGLLAAIIVLLLGFIVGKIIGGLVRALVEKLRIMEFLKKQLNIEKAIGKMDVPHILEVIVQWYVFVLFLTPAAELVMLPGLSVFLLQLSLWIPNLIAAVLLLLVGIIVAQYVAMIIMHTKSAGAELVAVAVKVVIVVMAVLMAIKQTGIDVSLAENSFLLVVAGIMLAFAIAFGKAGEEEAGSMIKKFKKHI